MPKDIVDRPYDNEKNNQSENRPTGTSFAFSGRFQLILPGCSWTLALPVEVRLVRPEAYGEDCLARWRSQRFAE